MKGSKNQICSETTGKCPCKEKFYGKKCDKKGECICKNSLIEPLKCDDCVPGAYGFPACKSIWKIMAFLL